MEAAAPEADVSCGVFRGLDGLAPNAIHRFVVSEADQKPEAMSADQAAAELGDPFATLVLLKGEFPQTAEEALARLAAAAGDGDPLAKPPRSFVLGEGSQLADDAAADGVDLGMRFVVATGSEEDTADVILSAAHPSQGMVELMAWDRNSGGFNYYRTVGTPPAWVFAGNSRHALSDPTQGKGPFESHPSGALVMKELKIPWNSWHSFEAPTPSTVFEDQDKRKRHPWFEDKKGAEDLERAVAIPSIERWARVRFDRIVAEGGNLSDPRRIMEQVLATPTVNLVSGRAESRNPDGKEEGVRVSPTFFVSSDALGEVWKIAERPKGNAAIGLTPRPAFQVPTEIYESSLERFEFALRDGQGFEQKGDTKFAFLVPERALEDDVVLREAIRIGLVTPRLAAALLMVDFPNPIFSARRESLLTHVPPEATIAAGASGFSEEMANTILARVEDPEDGSPESGFAERWNVGEDFVEPFNQLLASYFAAAQERLATQDGFDDFVRLAESRRKRAQKEMPIVREFRLLFPTTNIEEAEREMRPDATVVEIEE